MGGCCTSTGKCKKSLCGLVGLGGEKWVYLAIALCLCLHHSRRCSCALNTTQWHMSGSRHMPSPVGTHSSVFFPITPASVEVMQPDMLCWGTNNHTFASKRNKCR